MSGDAKVWPETLCSTDESRPQLHRPMRFEGRIVCTEGHMLAAIPDDGREASDETPGSLGGVLEVLSEDHSDVLAFDLDALREWAGPNEVACPDCAGREPEDCDECDGKGEVECDCTTCGDEHVAECSACEGRGTLNTCNECGGSGDAIVRDDRQGMFRGRRFNRRMLARILDGAPGTTVRMAALPADHRPLVLFGEGWDGLLMPLRPLDKNDWPAEDTKALEPLAIQPTEAS